MKKILFYLLGISLGLNSCSKSESVTSEDEIKYKVSLSVSNFKKEVSNMNSSIATDAISLSDSLKAHINYLTYAVYNLDGSLVSSWVQTADSTNFGHINVLIAKGEYSVVICGMKTKPSPEHQLVRNGIFIPEEQKIGFFLNQGMESPDTFVEKIPLKIIDNNIDLSVNLHRIMSQLEVNILDSIPAEAASIQIELEYYPFSYSLKDEIFYTDRFRLKWALDSSIKGTTNYKISTLILGAAFPTDVILRSFTSSNQLIAEKRVQKVLFEKNKKVSLSGKLFDQKLVSPNVIIDTKWNSEGTSLNF